MTQTKILWWWNSRGKAENWHALINIDNNETNDKSHVDENNSADYYNKADITNEEDTFNKNVEEDYNGVWDRHEVKDKINVPHNSL